MSAEPIKPGEYDICRECADTGATVPGNDGWVRHKECARKRNKWPHQLGRERVLGASITLYKGGDMTVVGNLRHLTTRLGVTQLAARLGELGEDYETLHPIIGLDYSKGDGEVVKK